MSNTRTIYILLDAMSNALIANIDLPDTQVEAHQFPVTNAGDLNMCSLYQPVAILQQHISLRVNKKGCCLNFFCLVSFPNIEYH